MHSLSKLTVVLAVVAIVGSTAHAQTPPASQPSSGEGGLPAGLSAILCLNVLTDSDHGLKLEEPTGRSIEMECTKAVLKGGDMLEMMLRARFDQKCEEVEEASPAIEQLRAFPEIPFSDISEEELVLLENALKFCAENDDAPAETLTDNLFGSPLREVRFKPVVIIEVGEILKKHGADYRRLATEASEVMEIAILQREEGIITGPELVDIRKDVNRCVESGAAGVADVRWNAERNPLGAAFDCIERRRAERVSASKNYKEATSPLWYAVPILLLLLVVVGIVYRVRSTTNDVELEV